MSKIKICITISGELFKKVESDRYNLSRSAFIETMLRDAMGLNFPLRK